MFNEGVGLLILFNDILLEFEFENLMKFLSIMTREYYSTHQITDGMDEDEIQCIDIIREGKRKKLPDVGVSKSLLDELEQEFNTLIDQYVD